jgi:hypothetical protein
MCKINEDRRGAWSSKLESVVDVHRGRAGAVRCLPDLFFEL